MRAPRIAGALLLALAWAGPGSRAAWAREELAFEAALAQARRGRVRGRVGPRASEEAVRQLERCEEAELLGLTRVAAAGGAARAAVRALEVRFARGSAAAVLECLGELPWEEARPALTRWVERAPREFEAGRGLELAARLLAPRARAAAIQSAIQRGDASAAKACIRAVAWAEELPEQVLALAELRLEGEVDQLRWLTLGEQARTEEVAARLLAAARGGQPAGLRALGRGLPPQRAAARAWVEAALREGRRSSELLGPALALEAPGRHGLALRLAEVGGPRERAQALRALPELRSDAPQVDFEALAVGVLLRSLSAPEDAVVVAGLGGLARWGAAPFEAVRELTAAELPLEIRRAAIATLATTRPRAPGVERLIELLGDPGVGDEALRNLVVLTGERLPPREQLWRTWLSRNRARLDPAE